MLSVIIVTHNSERFIDRCVASIDDQSVSASRVVIVDSGSANPSYLDHFSGKKGYEIHHKQNIGFAAANNFGLNLTAAHCEYVCMMNPDIFLEAETFESALALLSNNSQVGIVGGRLKGFDIDLSRPTGLLDSTGIFRSWYGRWYDRGQREKNAGNFQVQEEVPAVCGAFMFGRTAALMEAMPMVFDESFFMYKEDIDLCLRLRKKGWKLLYGPEVEMYHARGWAADRNEISYETKCLASKNEIRLNLKHRSPYLIWALGKYLAVRLFRI
ncbi:MAG: glycosyltransferase family 2 protein [Desulfofustis sp.]|nr:glycosyltransferase family 2 protein [Desulfofustis sp.]